MIKYLKSYFNKNKEQYVEKNNQNSISFILDDQRRAVIELNFPYLESEEDLKKIAEILFLINSGVYKKQIIDMVLELVDKEPNRAHYLKRILLYWSEHISNFGSSDLVDHSNKPCVSPLNFSKLLSARNE